MHMHIKSILAVGLSVFVLGAVAQQSPSTPSPREQLQQYIAHLQTDPSDDALRAKIIQLALKLDPKPANPPDLPEDTGAATYAFKSAQSEADMASAANLFAKALLQAPWRADLYFNEGVALEKAKHLDEAIKAFQFYLMASPNATDADDVKEKIGALKYQVTQAQDQERVAEQKRQAQQQAEAAVEAQQAAARRLEGRYVHHEHRSGRGWWRDTDYILDVRYGQVTQGTISNGSDGAFPYQKHYTVPLNGRSFHEGNETDGYEDGTISEDGTSITMTEAPEARYHEAPNTVIYSRQ